IAPTSPCLPSLLLATSTTGLLARRAKSAKVRSLGVSPARASITNISASARPIAVSVCSCIRAVSEPLAPSSRPAVSMTVNSRSPRRALPSRRSRVTPGSSSTSASFCPTNRLNSVDLPTLGRPIMAIVKDIIDPNALFRRACQSNGYKKSARERTARHRRRERGLCRCRRLIGRRRGGALAHDLGRLGRRRRRGGAAFLVGCSVGVRGRGGCGLLALGFRATLRFRFFRRRRRCGGGLRVRVVLLAGAPVEVLRHALFKARHAFGEYRLAVTGQLLLGVEEVEQVGRVETGRAATARQRARKRDEDSGCDQTLRAAHTGFPTQSGLYASAFGDWRQQGLQRFGTRAQARRRFAVIGDQIQPLPRCRGIVGAPGRQGQQFARGVAEGGARRGSSLEALFHVGIAGAFQQQLGGANPRQILLGDADAAVGG